MTFHDITIVIGSVHSRRTHDTERLIAAAVEVFRDMIERHGQHFRERLPVAGLERIELQWTQQGSCAMATFWSTAHGHDVRTRHRH